MTNNTQAVRRLAAALAAIASLLVAGTGSAAAQSPWNEGYPVDVAGDLTFERANGPTVTCSMSATLETYFDDMGGPCSSGVSAQLLGALTPWGYGPFGSQSPSPWSFSSSWQMAFTEGTWVEGDATTASQVVFDEAYAGVIDFVNGEPVTISGELEVTKPDGGLVTAPTP